MKYPKYLYHADKEPTLVRSYEEHEALGSGYVESPADLEKPKKASKKPAAKKSDKK